MRLKLLLGIIVVAALVAALVFSQRRSAPEHVSGFIEADEIRLGSRVGGRVAEVIVQEGDHVELGQVLVRLEPFDLKARLAQAEATLAAHRADNQRLSAGLRPEEIAQRKSRVDRLQATVNKLKAGPLSEEIAAAQSRLQLAEAQFDRAKKGYDRTMSLANRDTGAVSRDEIDLATESLKVAEAGLEVRREELLLMKRGTRSEDIEASEAELHEATQAKQLAEAGFRIEEIAQSLAIVQSAEAAVAVIRTQIDELDIKAGVAGIVDAIQLRPGDLVPANSPVLTLIDTSRLWVRVYVPENQLDIRLGELYAVTADSYPNQEFSAKVTFVSNHAEFTPRNVQTVDERAKQVFRVKLDLQNGSDRLRPGMAADIWLRRKLNDDAGH